MQANMIVLTSLDRVEQTVVLVYHVLGLAGGMGLGEMLGDEMDADPGYVRTIDAFREIGASAVANLLEEAIARKTAIAVGADTSKMRDFEEMDEELCALERDCVVQMERYVARSQPD